MNAPFGTIAFGASLCGLSIVTVTTQGCLFHKSAKWGHLHSLLLDSSTGLTTSVDLPSFFGLHPSQLWSISLLVVPMLGKTFNVDCTLPAFFFVLLPLTLTPLWLLTYFPESPRSRLARGSRSQKLVFLCQATFTAATRCLVKRVLPLSTFFALAPLPAASAPSPLLSSLIVGHSVDVACRAGLVAGPRTCFGLA